MQVPENEKIEYEKVHGDFLGWARPVSYYKIVSLGKNFIY
jgi:hypothetical protein